MADIIPDYHYGDVTCWSHYLWPAVRDAIETHKFKEYKAFDLGCGNGSVSNLLSGLGFEVIGVDPSESGVQMASNSFPHLRFYKGSAYEDLAAKYGSFPLVVSLEVVEHCYDPRSFARNLYALVDDGGIAIVSTPYHGYLKNLALAVVGKWNDHLSPLWDGGHIKFFSIATLRTLLADAGFRDIRFIRVGRIPPLAKSMVAVASKVGNR
jgi:2-polyprenyl-6-hydroxyphenyl methylase/3-demethylubiquinone-9 3-methyltransferase